ncbi:Tetraspanin, partial [Operophtera brumata]
MLVGGILQFVFREKVLSTLDRELFAAIPYYGVKHEYTKSWDDTQTYLQCCGRLDCKGSPNPTTMYMDGCLNKVIDFLREDAAY